MKTKLLESYRRGWEKINGMCNFDTVLVMEQKELEFQGYKFTIYPGMNVLAVDDDTLAKWLYLSRKVWEAGISGEELIRIITGVGESGEKN